MPSLPCRHPGHTHPGPAEPSATTPSEADRSPRETYVPRDPTDSVLVRTVRKHLPRFLEAAAREDGWTLPAFVQDALESLALCGDFTHGFTHFQCDRCSEPRIVPFACKGRLCVSCGGRRMAEFAAYAVDRLMPRCDYRQWVVSFPWNLRRALAFDQDLARAVFRIAGEVILAWVSSAAAEEGVFGRPAGVLHIQRFGDGLTLNPHAHFVTSDAVFCATDPPEPTLSADDSVRASPVLSFRTRTPSQADVQAVADRIERRVLRLLAAREAARDGQEPPPDGTDQDRLARLGDVQALTDHTTLGANAGPASKLRAKKPLAARSAAGFDVHAGVAIPSHARDALERLLRYLARPVVAEERLRELPNGNIAVDLKRAWSNNVRTLTFTPMALLARLSALVPPPAMHLTSYLGVISPHAALRPHVLPKPPPEDGPTPVAPTRPKKMPWSDLIERVFWVDPLACRCGGRLRLVAVVKNPTAIQAICAALHLSGHLAENRLPRGPPPHWPPPRARQRPRPKAPMAPRPVRSRMARPKRTTPRAKRPPQSFRDAKP